MSDPPRHGSRRGKVILGGTFDIFHKGHEALVAKAAHEGDQIILGITSDEMAGSTRTHAINPLKARREVIEAYVSKHGLYVYIVVICDVMGRTDKGAGAVEDEGPFNGIVVSPGSRKNAIEINIKRVEKGWQPIVIFEVPYVLADDGKPIHSTRIRLGEIDCEGRPIIP